MTLILGFDCQLHSSGKNAFTSNRLFATSLETHITILQCTIVGGRTKKANIKRSFVFVLQNGGDDVI